MAGKPGLCSTFVEGSHKREDTRFYCVKDDSALEVVKITSTLGGLLFLLREKSELSEKHYRSMVDFFENLGGMSFKSHRDA